MRRSDEVVRAQGVNYVAVPADREYGCEGCAADKGAPGLCAALPECSGRTFTVIFKEVD